MDALCERVKTLREESGLSQSGFADKFNIPKSTLQDWEHDRRVPPVYVVEMMEQLIKKPEVLAPISVDNPKTIELFAGAGGLALGVEKAGFNTIGLVEFDADACDTLRKNRPEWNIIHDDIANVSCQNLEEFFHIKKGELDLLSGGAPCQAFSYAGKRLGFEDTRGTLFHHYAIFLQKLQPKMFLFENVRGLLTHDGGKTYQTMLNVFEDAGYVIQKQVMNAWDYGVAQKRERLITIGIRNDLADKISYSFPLPHEYKPVLRDILNDVPDSPYIPYGEKKRKIFELK